jgi:hypothetical protein
MVDNFWDISPAEGISEVFRFQEKLNMEVLA